MPQIYIQEPRKALQNKKKIESSLDIKFSITNKLVDIQASPENEFIAIQVFEAINLGFKVPDALLIAEEGYGFEKINIKDITKRGSLKNIRGRIIGTKGKVLETFESLTDCKIAVHNSAVGIIGRTEDLEIASEAMKKLIKGSKHGHVFGFIERSYAEQRQKL